MHQTRDGAEQLRAFLALAKMATGSPWSVRTGRDDSFEVRARDVVVERDLPEAFARYLVVLKEVTDLFVDVEHRSAPHSKSRLRTLAKKVRAAMSAVRSEWVFVAPNEKGGTYFLHDCVRKVGAGTLSCADALFIDGAKHALPRLLELDQVACCDVPAGARTLVIPKRARSADARAEYRAYADHHNALHALSGRNELPARTQAMIHAILEHMDFSSGHSVLDIGCGDAALLRIIAPLIDKGIGTVVTEAERQRLVAEPDLKDFDFVTASFDDLAEIPGAFDRIVANGCIHFVRTRSGAERALQAMSTLLAPRGKLWIGELHATERRKLVFSSKLAAVRYAKSRYGNVFALTFIRYMWRHRHRAAIVVEPVPLDWWHVKPEAFVALAERCGFEVEGLWACRDLTGDTFYSLQDRYSCLLTKR